MSYQSMLQQVDEDQRWGGDGSGNGWGSHGRLKQTEESSLVQEVHGGESRSGGGSGAGGGYRGGFVAPLTLNTENRSGYGGDLTLFSPSELLSSSPRQPLQQNNASSPFSWQSLLGGQPSARWQPDAALQGFATFGGDQPGVEQVSSVITAYVQGKENVRPHGGGGQNEQCVAHEDDGVISEVDADRSGEVQDEWTNNVNSEKENWRKFGDFIVGDVKQEESENILEAGQRPGDGVESRKRYRQSRLQEHPEVIVNFEPSGSTSQSDSDSEESGKHCKKEVVSRKQKRPGQDADGNITWTDDSVRFLFTTYDAIHQRLWEESKGQVKYQKKWTPILKAMQVRFGNHFTKKQCQSKYWSVRRECTEYRITSTKAAATDPLWNPSIAGRELLKPKFYDVWLEVSGKNQAIVTKSKNSTVEGEGYSVELLKGESSRSLDKDGQPVKQRGKDSGSAMKEMQRLMLVHLQASERREEAMKYRAELMMELLTQHIEHVENRVSIVDESRTPQLYLLERVNHKVEKILEGFAALNQNLSMLH